MDTKIVSWLLNDCWGVSFKEGLIEAFSKIWISQSDLKFKNKKKKNRFECHLPVASEDLYKVP